MTKNTCCGFIHDGWRTHKCGKPAKFELNGKHYCGIHNPNKAPTKSQLDAAARYENEQKRWRLNSAAPDLLEALKAYLALTKDTDTGLAQAAKLANAAIAKATGETQ